MIFVILITFGKYQACRPNHLGLFDRRDARSSACRRHIEAFDPVEKNSRPPFKYPFNPTQFYRKP